MPRLTLFGRSLLLLGSLVLVNVVCWIVAGILFGRKSDTQPILSLALLAWVRS
jgi:high-affinity nickel-transport protein